MMLHGADFETRLNVQKFKCSFLLSVCEDIFTVKATGKQPLDEFAHFFGFMWSKLG